MSLVVGRYWGWSEVRARTGTKCRSKLGQPSTDGDNLRVQKKTSLFDIATNATTSPLAGNVTTNGTAACTSAFAADAYHIWTFSVTVTPYKSRGACPPLSSLQLQLTIDPIVAAGISYSDEERMALCAMLQDHVYVEMGMRFQDKEVPVFSFSRERGMENGEPHLNGHYDLNTSATDKPLVTRREQAALKAILDRATRMPIRLVLKLIPACNRTYGYGYDFKDMVCCLFF